MTKPDMPLIDREKLGHLIAVAEMTAALSAITDEATSTAHPPQAQLPWFSVGAANALRLHHDVLT